MVGKPNTIKFVVWISFPWLHLFSFYNVASRPEKHLIMELPFLASHWSSLPPRIMWFKDRYAQKWVSANWRHPMCSLGSQPQSCAAVSGELIKDWLTSFALNRDNHFLLKLPPNALASRKPVLVPNYFTNSDDMYACSAWSYFVASSVGYGQLR